MTRLVLTLLLSTPTLLHAGALQSSEIFTPETLNSGMSLTSDGFYFEITGSGGASALLAKSPSGSTKEVKLPNAGFSKPERLFYVRSYGCEAESIDVIIQLAPESNDDIKYRNYYRIIFSKDITSVISQFFDPSVSAANAVLPIQSVKNLESTYTKEKIICSGSKPIVEKQAKYKK